MAALLDTASLLLCLLPLLLVPSLTDVSLGVATLLLEALLLGLLFDLLLGLLSSRLLLELLPLLLLSPFLSRSHCFAFCRRSCSCCSSN